MFVILGICMVGLSVWRSDLSGECHLSNGTNESVVESAEAHGPRIEWPV